MCVTLACSSSQRWRRRSLGQLGVEGDGQDVALAHGHRVAVHLGQHLHLRAHALDPGGADEDRLERPVGPGRARPRTSASWRPKALRRTVTSSRPRCSRSSMIRPAQVPSTGRPERDEVAQRLGQPLALDAERDRGRLAAGDHQPVEPFEIGGHAHAARLRAQLGEDLGVRLEVALEGEDADRGGSPTALLEQAAVGLERADLDAGHRLAQLARGRGHALGVVVVGGGLDDRAGAALGVRRT